MSEQEKALDALAELSQEMEKARKQYEADNDDWWNGLTEEEREDAFYAVCRRIYDARVKDNRSYRGTLYDKFGFGPHMYRAGMECGFFALHNMLHEALEFEAMKAVTRFEVIDDKGRTYVKYLNKEKEEGIKYALQDDNRTLKVFIDELSWKEDL